MSDEKIVYIFRHGETDWNREGRLQGGTDIPLNDLGRKQAEQLTRFFRANPVEIFLSSDLGRAHETARIAAGQMKVEIRLDARLRETNLGDAEGLTGDEIDARFGAGTLAAWRNSSADEPGLSQNFRFKNGESKAEHLARTLLALEEFLEKTSYRKIAVASHGGALRRLIHHLRPELTDPVMISNCAVYEFRYTPRRRIWKVELSPVSSPQEN